MDRIKRNERLAALTKLLTASPNQLFTLSHFCEMFGAAKSTLSEDIDILCDVYKNFGLGRLDTVTGAAGGVRYRPYIGHEQAVSFLQELCKELENPNRLLPGGFLYLSDILTGAIAGGGTVFGLSALGGEKEEGAINIIRSDRDITVSEIPGNTGYSDLTVAQVAALVGESVVEITTSQLQTNLIYGQYVTSGAGSGVIFDQKGTQGYIVTNYHVIEGADKISVRVKLGDSYREYAAEYIAGDAAGDIAVIRIKVADDHTLTEAVFVSDSDKLIVGEEVVAIGNPLGELGGTVTNGIISALDREIVIENNTMVLLQTNAAINPGNSGGATCWLPK